MILPSSQNQGVQNEVLNAIIVMQLSALKTTWCNTRPLNISPKKRNKNQKIKNGNRGSQLKIVHWNLGSRKWQNKTLDILSLIEEKKPSILAISEANLWDGLPQHEMQIEGYKLILPPTMGTLGYARVVMLVKNNLIVHKLDQHMENDLSAVWIRVGSKGTRPTHVGAIYREHHILGQDNLNITTAELKRQQEDRWSRIVANWARAGQSSRYTAVGDMNLDQGRWGDPEHHLAVMVDTTKNEIESRGHIQLVNRITRSWKGQTDSIIDHIWTNSSDRVYSHENEVRGVADHNVVTVTLSTNDMIEETHNVRRRSWKTFKPEEFIEELKGIDWTNLYSASSADIANSELENNIGTILNRLAPMKIIQQRTKYKKWLTEDTKSQMEERDRLREVARLTQEDLDWELYKRTRNQCTKLQSKDRKNYLKAKFEKIEEEKDTARLFSKTRELLHWRRSGAPTSFLINGKFIRKQKEVADAQIDFFTDKVKNIKSTLPKVNFDPLEILKKEFKKWRPSSKIPTLELSKISPAETEYIISKLKNSFAYGRDDLDAVTLKLGKKALAGPIAHTINLSLGSSNFPAKWKMARVIPLRKSTDLNPRLPSSFRPIAQLCVVSKITERWVQLQLASHMEKTQQFHMNHHAYRGQLSTTTALIQATDYISEATDRNEITASMSIDQSAAFDCVIHSILLQKLSYYSLGEDTLEWMRSYLSYRSAYVTIGSADSKMVSTDCGVPQGSVLGPILYLMYVNELPCAVNNDGESRKSTDDRRRHLQKSVPSS